MTPGPQWHHRQKNGLQQQLEAVNNDKWAVRDSNT